MRAKSQPNLMRVKTASVKKSINPAEYLQRRKRRGQPLEISASSVTNAVYNYPAINKTKPVASLFQGRPAQAWRGFSAMSYQPQGMDPQRRPKASVVSSSSNTGRMMPMPSMQHNAYIRAGLGTATSTRPNKQRFLQNNNFM